MVHTLKRIIRTSPAIGGPLRALQSRYELRHLPDGQYREQRDDLAIRDLIERTLRPDSSAVDIGANRGRILEMIVQRAPRGRHHAIEALPHLAESLAARYPGVTVHQCAASDTTGSADFTHAVNLSGWSGLRASEHFPAGTMTEQIRVPVRRLDDLIPAAQRVDFIKIDVEGAELHVLRGGLETIRRSLPVIVFEYGEIHGQPYGTTPQTIHDFLTVSCGLTVRSLLGRQARLSREAFVAACRHATATNYDRASQGNFLATPG